MHFIPGLSLQLTPRELNKAIGLGLTTFPLPSSAGGFAYTTDPATGEIHLATTTFGPVYAERAFTIGKGRFDFGLAFQPTSFDSFETAELGDGSMQFILEHNNCCPATQSRYLKPRRTCPQARDQTLSTPPSSVTCCGLRFPSTSRQIPRCSSQITVSRSVSMSARPFQSSACRWPEASRPQSSGRPQAPDRGIHNFDGQDSFTVAETRSATGLGDVLLRAKYNFVRSGGNALAAAIDLRLPTGNEDDLLGTGATQTRVQFLASGEYGVFAPHASFGYTFSNGEVSDLTADVDEHRRVGRAGQTSTSRRLPLIRAYRTKSTTPSGSAPRHIRG